MIAICLLKLKYSKTKTIQKLYRFMAERTKTLTKNCKNTEMN